MVTAGRRARRCVRRGAAAVVGLLLGAGLLTACGVDDGDVEDLGRLPGVDGASSSCELGRCTVRVEVRPSIEAGQLATVLTAARETGATTVQVTEAGESDASPEPRVDLELDDDSDPAADDATAALVVDSFDRPGVLGWRLTRSADGSTLAASVQETPGLQWPTGRELWDGVATLPGPAMVLTTRPEDRPGPSRLRASGDYPERAVAFTRAVARQFGATRLTGVRIGARSDDVDPGDVGVLLGVRSASDATALESFLDDARGAEGLAVSVVVADNVLAARPDPTGGAADPAGGAGTEADRRALLESLEDDPAVSASVQAGSLRVRSVGSLAEVRAALDGARRAHPEAYARVPVTVVPPVVGGDPEETELDLSTVGSLDLLDLAADLGGLDGALAVGIQAHGPRYDYLKPPSDTEAFVSVRATRPTITRLDALVAHVAQVLARWGGPETSLTVAVGVEDPDGRRASVVLRVDRRGGTWVASSSGRGTDESIARGVRVWNARS